MYEHMENRTPIPEWLATLEELVKHFEEALEDFPVILSRARNYLTH